MFNSKEIDYELPSNSDPPKRPVALKRVLLAFIGLAILGLCRHEGFGFGYTAAPTELSPSSCLQVEPLVPTKNAALYEDAGKLISTEEFKQRAVEWLGGAVRIPYVPCAITKSLTDSNTVVRKLSMGWARSRRILVIRSMPSSTTISLTRFLSCMLYITSR